ncbi:MAG: DUF547 domain-containing protein [Dehalococcoidia bacterium]
MTSSAEIGLLRLLRGRTDETGVLNVPGHARTGDSARLPERLASAAARLRAVAVHDGSGDVDYAMLTEHAIYREYREVASELDAFDPWTLGPREQRLAFWINVFNALAIDAVVAFGLRGSIRDAPGFFRRAAYAIGGRRFSAEEIEHGILRGNRPALPRLPAPFPDHDPRLALRVQPLEPRVHFALNCATRSCPPLRVYSAACVDAELELAAAAFVHGGVSIEAERVVVSSVFQFYADDFGGPAGVAAWICRFLDDPAGRDAVLAAFSNGRVAYEQYDWALNSAAESPA